MIQLTEKVIVVEVPNDGNVQEFTITENNRKQIMDACIDKSKDTKVIVGNCSLIGVTPLSEDEWKGIVDTIHIEIPPHASNDYAGSYDIGYVDYMNQGEFAGWNGDAGYCNTATESGNSLLESKGLDINKRYAIIKIATGEYI